MFLILQHSGQLTSFGTQCWLCSPCSSLSSALIYKQMICERFSSSVAQFRKCAHIMNIIQYIEPNSLISYNPFSYSLQISVHHSFIICNSFIVMIFSLFVCPLLISFHIHCTQSFNSFFIVRSFTHLSQVEVFHN